MLTPDQCQPPYKTASPPGCRPRPQNVLILLVVITGLIVAAYIAALFGFATLAILLFLTSFVVLFAALARFLIACLESKQTRHAQQTMPCNTGTVKHHQQRDEDNEHRLHRLMLDTTRKQLHKR